MADWYFRNSQGPIMACPGCGKIVRSSDEYCPYCARRLNSRPGLGSLFKRLPFVGTPFFATNSLVAFLVFMFFLQQAADLLLTTRFGLQSSPRGLFGMFGCHSLTYILMGWNSPDFTLAEGQLWRLVSYCFLHAGLLHILFNCYALRDLGRLVESLWDGRAILPVFILSGAVGGLASLLMTRGNSLGASGGICGLLGLLLGAYYKNKYQIGSQLGSALVRWAVMIIVFGIVAGADNGAHIGGMIGGFVMGWYLPPERCTRTPDRDRKIWAALQYAGVALALVCLACAAVFFFTGQTQLKQILLH